MKALWQKLWLLFAVIWVVVAALQTFSILAFSEEAEKAWRPVLAGIAVPVITYLFAWLWFRPRRSPPPPIPK